MNLTHTISFETFTIPETLDPDGIVIEESTSYETYAVRIWDLDNPSPENAPFLFQPFDHNTSKPFASEAEAEAWYNWYEQNILLAVPTEDAGQ